MSAAEEIIYRWRATCDRRCHNYSQGVSTPTKTKLIQLEQARCKRKIALYLDMIEGKFPDVDYPWEINHVDTLINTEIQALKNASRKECTTNLNTLASDMATLANKGR